MPEWLKAILFGVVEGVTEWLPVSSTGHMILLDGFLKLKASPEFWGLFLVAIQLGAVLAVALLYYERLCPIGRHQGRLAVNQDAAALWKKIMISCLPAGAVGILFDEQIDALFYNGRTVAVMLIVVGAWFLWAERRGQREGAERRGSGHGAWKLRGKGARQKDADRGGKVEDLAHLPYQAAFGIGLFQLVAAVFPGTSRSGATILGALLLGVSRKAAAEYSFLLAVPVMLGASGLKLLKFGFRYSNGEMSALLFGMAAAFLASAAAVRFLTGYLKSHDFRIFGWYRILLGAAALMFF